MFNCLKRDYRQPTREYGSHGEGESFQPIWGYIIPHIDEAQGAETKKGLSEYSYGGMIANYNNNFIAWDDRDDGGVKSATKRLVAHGINATFEDHKNAYNHKVGGAEILIIKGDELSKFHAERILEAFALKFPDRNIRGVKEMRKGGRGYNNLLLAKKGGADVALLGELFFIDNPNDFIDPKVYAEFIRDVLS